MRFLLTYFDPEGEQNSTFDDMKELNKFIGFQESLPEKFEVEQICELPETIEPLFGDIHSFESANKLLGVKIISFKAKRGKDLFMNGNFKIDMTGEIFFSIGNTNLLFHELGIFRRTTEDRVDMLRVFVPEIKEFKLTYCVINNLDDNLLIRNFEPNQPGFVCGLSSFEGCEILKSFIKSK